MRGNVWLTLSVRVCVFEMVNNVSQKQKLIGVALSGIKAERVTQRVIEEFGFDRSIALSLCKQHGVYLSVCEEACCRFGAISVENWAMCMN